MLSFSLVAEALTGLIYHRPSGENSKFAHSKETFKLKDRRGDSGDNNERNEDDLKSSMVDVRKKSV